MDLVHKIAYPMMHMKSDQWTRVVGWLVGFIPFKISKLSWIAEPGSTVSSTDCKVLLVGLFLLWSPINCACRTFLSRWAVVSKVKSLHWEGNSRWLMCHFSQGKCARAKGFLRERETAACLRVVLPVKTKLGRSRWELHSPHCFQEVFLLETHRTNLCRAFPAPESFLFVL